MLFFTYDKTFEGLMTCVFDAFNKKQFPHGIIKNNENIPLFTTTEQIITDPDKAVRVTKSLTKLISKSAMNMLLVCFVSEADGVDLRIFNYVRKTFEAKRSIETNFADDDVLSLSKTYSRVKTEAERVRQFVRFQKTADNIFFAVFEPAFNVLPLTVDFFEDRYADQPWVIYDIKRKYGYYYDLNKTEEVYFKNLNVDLKTGKIKSELKDDDENTFTEAWKHYLKSITIAERKNLKLQRQHMPKRFWKFLTEKN